MTQDTIERRLAQLEAKLDRLLAATGDKPAGPNMSLAEAAAYLGYSTHHLRRLAVEKRMIPCRQVGKGGKLSFRKADLDAFGRQDAVRPVRRGRKRLPAKIPIL
ncbi:helix-turn-helix domain-containing protein [Desulfobulbus elongatus]|uniref:helix-turn-helix domain-containing protein n=1 Tax=Desulfobulbus elongatus TaxID=53332 RepID=UPI00048769A1|nr:helix-turn-helix domain-containing protein [Desulfobulbus elongatus]